MSEASRYATEMLKRRTQLTNINSNELEAKNQWITTQEHEIELLESKVKELSDRLVKSCPQWIPCSERMPLDDESVLVYSPRCKKVFKAIYRTCSGCWVFSYDHIQIQEPISHWMPLPELPKEVENDAKVD
jgi:hypothetical protein